MEFSSHENTSMNGILIIHQTKSESEKAIWFMIPNILHSHKKKTEECEVDLCICSQSSQEVIEFKINYNFARTQFII